MAVRAVGYLTAVALSIASGAYGMHAFDARKLAGEQAGRAAEAQRHAADLLTISRAAADAEQRAAAAHDAAASQVAAVDAQLTKERIVHETENRNARAALVAGTDRLRVAVSHCAPAGTDGVLGTAGATSMGDGAAAVADLDPATAQRVFAVVGDDQREIDKLKALQEYVCAIRTTTSGCGNR